MILVMIESVVLYSTVSSRVNVANPLRLSSQFEMSKSWLSIVGNRGEVQS